MPVGLDTASAGVTTERPDVRRGRSGWLIKTARGRLCALLSASDLVLVLDEGHRRWILDNFPQFRGRVHKLGKWRAERDVADPYQLPREAFDQAYLDIVECLSDWTPHLLA